MSLLAISAMSFPEMSPAIFSIDLGFLGLGKFPIRWYALAYIGGLLIGWRLALARFPMCRKNLSRMTSAGRACVPM